MVAELGRYELLRPIAAGGMATVYLGKLSGEGGFERLIAIKLLHPHIAAQPEFVTMFLDEARLAAQIRHPNVVPTLAVERGPDGMYLVMEYVEGHALHSVLRMLAQTRTALPLPISLRIALDMLEGLHAAHELRDETGEALNIVHRNVSPQNVLVGVDGVSRITDFGVAHARSRLTITDTTSIKGKVGYLSPEQVVSGNVDRRSDLFSAGIVLWELMTRRRLFRGSTDGQTLARIMGGAKESPSDRDPTIPPAISEVTMKALAANPDARFATAIQFADALEAAANASGVQIAKAREVSSVLASLNIPAPSTDGLRMPAGNGTGSKVMKPVVASSPPEPPRRRWAVALGLALLVGSLVIVLLLFRSFQRSEPTAESTPATAPPSAPTLSRPETPPPAPTQSETPLASETPTAAPAPSAEIPTPTPESVRRAEPRSRPKTRGTGAGYKPEGL